MSQREDQLTAWNRGLPPKDGGTYHVRQRVPMINGDGEYTVQDDPGAFWHNGGLVRRSAIHEGLIHLVLMNEWRAESNAA